VCLSVEKLENRHLHLFASFDLAAVTTAGTGRANRRKAIHFQLMSESVIRRKLFGFRLSGAAYEISTLILLCKSPIRRLFCFAIIDK